MNFLNLQEQPLLIAVAAYLAAAAVVWVAGTRASRYANTISDRTGIGGAVIGMVLLGSITSLPEIGTSATAALGGDAGLAVTNLLGGVAFQIVLLAMVDAFIGRDALTAKIFNPTFLLQTVVCILLLALAVSGTIAGDFSVLGVGAWSIGMLVTYGFSIFFVRGQERHARWIPQTEELSDQAKEQKKNAGEGDLSDSGGDRRNQVGAGLVLKLIVVGVAILAAGYMLTRSAEAIATQAGIETNVAGLTLLAVATSLPEVSTAIAAVKLDRNDLAIGDVLGGNMFDLMLIFFVDALYSGPPVLGEVGSSASLAGLLGLVITAIFLTGMIERRNRTIFRMGYDSFLVLLCYAGGLTLIFSIATSAAGI